MGAGVRIVLRPEKASLMFNTLVVVYTADISMLLKALEERAGGDREKLERMKQRLLRLIEKRLREVTVELG